MCRADPPKSLYGLIIFTCAVCLLSASPPSAGSSVADLAGKWHLNATVTGPGAPWWLKATITVKPDGTFTGSDHESDGSFYPNVTGAFSASASGFVLKVTGSKKSALCHLDLNNTVMSCTETCKDGSTDLLVGVKQAASSQPEL